VELMDEPSKYKPRIGDLNIFLHGHGGTGKTTFSAEFPDTYHFMFDPGAKTLPIRQSPIGHWLEFVALKRKADKDKRIRTYVVDGMEDAWELCFNFMCDEVLM